MPAPAQKRSLAERLKTPKEGRSVIYDFPLIGNLSHYYSQLGILILSILFSIYSHRVFTRGESSLPA